MKVISAPDLVFCFLHFSINITASDKESGIYGVKFTISGTTGTYHANALSLPREKCKMKDDCTCSLTGRCQLASVEAVFDNCIFKGRSPGNYTLEFTVINEANLSATTKPRWTVSQF